VNTGRTLAIGDIHGCDIALEVLLRELKIMPEDTVVVLGDVIDRGPDSRRCIKQLLELKTRCQFLHIMGNHEEMMLDALYGGEWADAWPRYGGVEMLESYGGSFSQIPPEHLEFIRNGREYIETETTIFSHAAIRGEFPVDAQDKHWLRWSRIGRHSQPHFSGKRVICGHTAQSSGLPLVLPGWVCIDTYVYGENGALTAIDVDNDLIYQAEQSGKYRGCYPLEDFIG
jgi:serine/threonine protein phosphatase 1